MDRGPIEIGLLFREEGQDPQGGEEGIGVATRCVTCRLNFYVMRVTIIGCARAKSRRVCAAQRVQLQRKLHGSCKTSDQKSQFLKVYLPTVMINNLHALIIFMCKVMADAKWGA